MSLSDMEHGLNGIPEALAYLSALDAVHTSAMLRLPEASVVWAKKALDLGPASFMLPAIESPVAAADAVSHCRYPPRGVRGTAHPIVCTSAYGFDDSFLSHCEDDTLVICQVETVTGGSQRSTPSPPSTAWTSCRWARSTCQLAWDTCGTPELSRGLPDMWDPPASHLHHTWTTSSPVWNTADTLAATSSKPATKTTPGGLLSCFPNFRV